MKNFLACFALFMVFLASCSQASLPPTAIPIASLSPTAEVTHTPVATVELTPTATPEPTFDSPTLPSPNIQEAHITQIDMLDETSGWSQAQDRSGKFYLLHTSDGGLNWNDVTPNEYYSPSFLNARVAWALFFGSSPESPVKLAQTTDSGNSWVILNEDMPMLDPYLFSLTFEDEKNGRWSIATIGAGTVHTQYYRTTDGGVTWEPAAFNISKDWIGKYYINSDGFGEVTACNGCGTLFYFDLSRMLFAPGPGSPTTLFLTTDSGKTWRKIELVGLPSDIDPESSPIRYPTFFDNNEGILPFVIGSSEAESIQVFIYSTQNGGSTWQLESGPTLVDKKAGDTVEIDFITRLDGFLLSDKGLQITHDGGKTWTQVAWPGDFASSEANVMAQLDFVNLKTGWVVLEKYLMGPKMASGVFKTTDGGLTWTELLPAINP